MSASLEKTIMKPLSEILFIGAVTLGLCASAQPFTSGSNGSYGPITVAADTTLEVPADGIFHCTTITINVGRTLTFRRNAANTPVYLLAQGNVSISGRMSLQGYSIDDSTPNLLW